MMIQGNFNGLEVLKIAMSIEDEGIKFYTDGAKHTSGKLKDFLLHAAGQEMQHKEKFQKLYNKLLEKKGTFDDEYLFDEQVAAYLKSLAENQIFVESPDEDAFQDLKTAAQRAVEAEETTVELYTRMYNGAGYEDMKDILAELIQEEKEHVQYFKLLLEEVK